MVTPLPLKKQLKRSAADLSVKPVKAGSVLSVRGFESRHNLKFLWALLPLIGIAVLCPLMVPFGIVEIRIGLAIIALLLVVLLALLAWAYWLVQRTFPVALTNEGMLVDHPHGRFELAWSDITHAVQEFYMARYTQGFLLTVRFRRGEKEESLQLGFTRVGKGLLFPSTFLGKVRITPGYDEALAYLRTKGYDAPIPTGYEKLAENIAKAKAKGDCIVVRQ